MSNTRTRWPGRLVDRLREVSPGWLVFALVAALAALLGDLASGRAPVYPANAPPAGVVEIREAVAWPGRHTADAAPPAAIALPALGPMLPLDSEGRTVLRLRFDWPSDPLPETLFAAYLGGSCGSIDADLNGTAVQRDAESEDAGAQLCPRPRLVPLPSSLLRRSGNQLDIRLHGRRLAETSNARMAAYIAPVWIGPLPTLQRVQTDAEAVQVGLPRLMHIGLLLLGGVVLLVSRSGNNVMLLRLYGLLLLVWSAILGMIVWIDRPGLPAIWFDVLVAGLWTPTLALAVRLLQALCGRHHRWPFKLLAVQGVLIPLGLLLGPVEWNYAWSMAWAVVLAIEALAAFAVYLTNRWWRRREEFWLGLASWAAVVAVWALDALSTPTGLPLPLAIAWISGSPFGWGALAIITGVQIVSGLTRALIAAEARRSFLHARMLSITSVVERNFSQMAEMRVAHLTERERKRIAADLHDDLGGKLLTIVHTCNDERIATLGREALDEMRLSVRGLSSSPMPLADALADWRAEAMTRLGRTKIRLAWHGDAGAADHALSARAFVQITRILREAISNVARHSQAGECSIRLVATAGQFAIRIKDDGRGLPDGVEPAVSAGHGLASIRQRVRQLDGSCEINSISGTGTGTGTEIRLTFPL